MKATIYGIGLSLVLAMNFGAYTVDQKGEEEMSKESLQVGDIAPDVEFVAGYDSNGNAVLKKLSDFQGKKNVLVAFYPKAFTSGCTKQLCGYRDDIEDLKTHDLEIIAVSADEQSESDRFKEHHQYPFVVVGDSEKKIINAFKVPVSPSGNATRSVFLIDKKGKIAYIDLSYKVEEGKAPLYEAIKNLGN